MTLRLVYGKVITDFDLYIKEEEFNMAVKATNRKPQSGNDRSHANNASKRTRKLNLQVHRLEDGTKVRITAREKRTLRKDEKMAA